MAELTGDELKAKLATEDQLDKIIAAINPKKYSSNPKAVMALLKKGNFWQAVKESKPVPAAQHKLVYDSLAEQLEPIYFWILDFMNGMFGGKVEKLIDNFSSSPGSGHFGEMGIRKSQMQQQASTVLATINSVLKSVINLSSDSPN